MPVDLWSDGLRDFEAERQEEMLTAAMVASAALQAVAIEAESEDDFENRISLLEPRIEAVASSLAVPGSADHLMIRASLPERWFENWAVLAEAKREEKAKSRPTSGNLRQSVRRTGTQLSLDMSPKPPRPQRYEGHDVDGNGNPEKVTDFLERFDALISYEVVTDTLPVGGSSRDVPLHIWTFDARKIRDTEVHAAGFDAGFIGVTKHASAGGIQPVANEGDQWGVYTASDTDGLPPETLVAGPFSSAEEARDAARSKGLDLKGDYGYYVGTILPKDLGKTASLMSGGNYGNDGFPISYEIHRRSGTLPGEPQYRWNTYISGPSVGGFDLDSGVAEDQASASAAAEAAIKSYLGLTYREAQEKFWSKHASRPATASIQRRPMRLNFTAKGPRRATLVSTGAWDLPCPSCGVDMADSAVVYQGPTGSTNPNEGAVMIADCPGCGKRWTKQKRKSASLNRSPMRMNFSAGARHAQAGESRYVQAAREVVRTESFQEIDGVILDLFTASAIVQVYDAASDENRAKMNGLSLPQLADIAMRMARRTAASNSFPPKDDIEAGGDVQETPASPGASEVNENLSEAKSIKDGDIILESTGSGVSTYRVIEAKADGDSVILSVSKNESEEMTLKVPGGEKLQVLPGSSAADAPPEKKDESKSKDEKEDSDDKEDKSEDEDDKEEGKEKK